MNDYMTQAWPPPAEEQNRVPLVNGAPPIVSEEDAPAPAGSSQRRVLFYLWLIIFVSIHLAVAWTLFTAQDQLQEYCTSPLQPIAAVIAPLLLWTITIIL
jgi:hypothetical protein